MASIGDAGLAGIGPNAIANATGDPCRRAHAPVERLVKRAVFGLVLLVTLVAGGACLLHASIEADGDPAAGHIATQLVTAV
jgi:hypothetical protein